MEQANYYTIATQLDLPLVPFPVHIFLSCYLPVLLTNRLTG